MLHPYRGMALLINIDYCISLYYRCTKRKPPQAPVEAVVRDFLGASTMHIVPPAVFYCAFLLSAEQKEATHRKYVNILASFLASVGQGLAKFNRLQHVGN